MVTVPSGQSSVFGIQLLVGIATFENTSSGWAQNFWPVLIHSKQFSSPLGGEKVIIGVIPAQTAGSMDAILFILPII